MPAKTTRTRPVHLRAEIFELTSNAGHTDVTIYLVNEDGDLLAFTMLEFKGAGHKRRAAACLAAVTGAHEVLAAIRVLASVDMTTRSRCGIAVQFIDSMVERATVSAKSGRVAVLAAAALVAVAACDAAPVDGFTAPAAGITSAASTDAPPAQPGTTGDETGDATDADATGAGTGTGGSTTGEPSTTTAAVDATTTSGGDDTTGEPDPSTTGADTTTADPSTGEANTSTSTGDESTGADTSTTSTGGDTTTTTGDEGTSTSTSTGEPPPIELPPECLSYTSLVDANRNVDFGIYGPKTCDAPSLAAGWYRFEGKAGVQMPTAPPPIYSCGTHAPGWMSGGPHPTVADGAVERTACYHWDNDGDGPLPDKPCWVSMPMQVRDCGDFYVYRLTPSAACASRICGEDV